MFETPTELPIILEESRRLGIRPMLGVRVKLSSRVGGNWHESSGDRSIFGLTPSDPSFASQWALATIQAPDAWGLWPARFPAAALLGPRLRDLPVEEFHVAILDAQHRLERDVCVTRGILNSSLVHPREVFKPAIAANASAIVSAPGFWTVFRNCASPRSPAKRSA